MIELMKVPVQHNMARGRTGEERATNTLNYKGHSLNSISRRQGRYTTKRPSTKLPGFTTSHPLYSNNTSLPPLLNTNYTQTHSIPSPHLVEETNEDNPPTTHYEEPLDDSREPNDLDARSSSPSTLTQQPFTHARIWVFCRYTVYRILRQTI